ncbi:phosphopantetheine-binding protein [Streptomyces diastatochromogenes]|nr:phosphopantetheine-binding protein [Streptomyces diastatochromogenes]
MLPGDNFFKLGGHSLLAGKLTNRIRGTLGLQASIRDVFLAPTPRRLLRRLDERGDGPARPRCGPSPRRCGPHASRCRRPSSGSGSWAARRPQRHLQHPCGDPAAPPRRPGHPRRRPR